MQVTLATFSVNSLKARMGNLLEWLESQPVDILLLQETKTTDDQFPRMELEDKGYNLAFHGQKTYNGVCIASKFPIDDVVRGLPMLYSPHEGSSAALLLSSPPEGERDVLFAHPWGEVDCHIPPTDSAKASSTPPQGGSDYITEEDTQARYIEAVISLHSKALRVASAYVPNGMAVDSDKFPYKLRFFERLRAHWQKQLQFHEMAVLGGDFNCAPDALDVYDAAALEGSVCYHHDERVRLRALTNLGLYDAFRSLHPNERAYSWWDYRGGSFERGHGLRIDHMLLSPQAMDACNTCWIDSAPRAQEKPSDHAPVLVTLHV